MQKKKFVNLARYLAAYGKLLFQTIVYTYNNNIIIMQGPVPGLYFAPNMPEISVDSGNDAVLQCVWVDDPTISYIIASIGSFSWEGPAVTSHQASYTLDTSHRVSTLTIASVGRTDEGQYSCSYLGADTVFISLDVVCKLPAIVYRSRVH